MFRAPLRHPRMRGQTPKARAAVPLAAGSARNLAQFFAPNGPHHEQEGELGTPKTPTSAEKNGGSHKSDISDPMWRTVTAKRAFLDPNAFYPDVEITDSSILDAVLNTTYEPSRSWSEICTTNLGTPPEPGSFVEFVHQHEIHFGVVLREPYARFNRYHNRMIVLTLHNDLVKVYPQDITFCMHRVLDGAEIRRHEILINRFNESYDARARLVQILHQFMALIAAHKHLVSHALKACHSNVASDEKASPVCLSDIAVFVSALDPSAAFSRALPSYFHQSALLMAIYLEMCTDPSRWMVPGCIPSERTTNLSFCASSNTLAPPPLLFAAPVPVLDDVSKFMHLDKKHMAAFSSFLESLIQSPIKYDDLVLQFGIWDAARFKSALKAMMYAIIYPHPHLLHKLSTMPVFGAASGAAGASAVSSESITKLLNAIGLYDNPQNALTDPFMSAGIFGRVKKLSLIASSTKDLDTSSVHHSASVEAKKEKFQDNFPHLRTSRQFFHDTTAYILPGLNPNLAISMEEINSRRFLINLHVADLASRLSPSSTTFAKWTGCNASLENIPNVLGVEKSPLLPAEATHDVFFRKSRPRTQKEHFSVGDYIDEKRYQSRGTTQTCMTISFEYNSYLEDPMKNFSDSVRISFDALQDFQFKPLDPSVLEKSLTGKLEPSIFGKLKLFQHKEPKKQDNEALLDANDHYNLNFIYNVLRRHFEARNRNYAVSVNHKSSPRDVCKTLSAERDSDTINTHVSLVQDEEVFEKTSFLRSETEVLAGRLVSEYTAKNHIPVFYDTKELLHQQEPETMIRDEVLIKHDNLLLPDFSASSYFQIPYGRDVSGHVSTSASIVASNFLGMDTISTYPEGENSRVGTRKGLVNVVDATESIKAYLNQLQILQHVHFTHTAHAQVFKSTHSYSHLRALGYSLHGSMSRNIIEAYTSRFTACALGSSYLAATQRKYWVLKAVEQKPHLFTDMRCVVTHISRDIELGSVSEDNSHPQSDSDLPPHQLFDQSSWPSSECQAVRAYCEELGIEVELLVGREREVMVGSELTASAVLHVDASSGIILMG